MQTQTPTLDFTAEVLYTLGNVSSLVNVHWYLGRSLKPLFHNPHANWNPIVNRYSLE